MRATVLASLAVLILGCSGSPPPDANPPESSGGTPPPAATEGAAAGATPPGPAPSAAASAGPAAPAASGAAAAGKPKNDPNEAPLLGKLTDADVQATLSKNYGNFDPCYPESLKKKNGDIKVQMKPTIGPGGKVNELLVTKSSGDKKFDACVVEAFKKIQFPASKEGSAFVSPTWIELGGQTVMQPK